MKSITEIKVRNFHIDQFGIVNHARYLELMEEARWRYLEDNGLVEGDIHAPGVMHVVVNININYRKPAGPGDVLRIETRVVKKSDKSFTMGQKIMLKKGNTLVADAEVTNVFIDSRTNRVHPIDENILTAWSDLAAAGSCTTSTE